MAEAVASSCGVLEGGEHVYPVRVYYDDTDAAGMVYYANYLRMSERARTEMMRLLGAEHSELARRERVVMAVRRCEVDYLRPARLDDVLRIHTRILEVGGASFRAEQVVRRAGEDLVRMKIRIACVTAEGRAARLPRRSRETLQRFVDQTGATHTGLN